MPRKRASSDSRFSKLLSEHAAAGLPVILDGAMGTGLDDLDVRSEGPAWTGFAPISHYDLVEDLHRRYADAGADILTTCTFRTSRRSFRAAGHGEHEWREAIAQAVRAAKVAGGTQRLVAGSVGPLEDCFRPDLAPAGTGAEDEHSVTMIELLSNGVDILWLETFASGPELLCAATAAAKATEIFDIPFAAGMVTDPRGDMLDGTPIEEAVKNLEAMGAFAVGVNCIPPWYVDRALDKLLATDLPVYVSPNLGYPEKSQGWTGHARMNPGDLAVLAAQWIRRGVSIIGTCCGSTWEHTRALSNLLG